MIDKNTIINGNKWLRINKTKSPQIKKIAINDHAIKDCLVSLFERKTLIGKKKLHLQRAIVDLDTYPIVPLNAALASNRTKPNKNMLLQLCNPPRENLNEDGFAVLVVVVKDPVELMS